MGRCQMTGSSPKSSRRLADTHPREDDEQARLRVEGWEREDDQKLRSSWLCGREGAHLSTSTISYDDEFPANVHRLRVTIWGVLLPLSEERARDACVGRG